MLDLLEACGDDDHRRLALRTSCELIVRCLVRSRLPDPKGLALLQGAVVNAAMAGDRDLLRIVPRLVKRLDRSTPEDQPWTEHWRGQLSVLATVAELALALLEIELSTGRAKTPRMIEAGDW